MLDYEGGVDLDEKFCEYLDYTIASLHISCIQPGTEEQNTQAFLGVMKNPKLFIIGHPDDGTYAVDFERLAKAAAENRVLIELNEASVAPDSYRLNGRENALRMLDACKRWQTRVILSSDAHTESEILEHRYGAGLLESVDFPLELIANLSAERTLAWLQERKDFVKS